MSRNPFAVVRATTCFGEECQQHTPLAHQHPTCVVTAAAASTKLSEHQHREKMTLLDSCRRPGSSPCMLGSSPLGAPPQPPQRRVPPTTRLLLHAQRAQQQQQHRHHQQQHQQAAEMTPLTFWPRRQQLSAQAAAVLRTQHRPLQLTTTMCLACLAASSNRHSSHTSSSSRSRHLPATARPATCRLRLRTSTPVPCRPRRRLRTRR